VGGRGCLALTILFVSLFVFLGQAYQQRAFALDR
jgi:hypothetical protein